jgi:hypothetical protein
MDHRGLIAPHWQVRHDAAVHSGAHKGTHGRLKRHTVRVQKAQLASRRTETERLPVASLAWRAARRDWITNPGKYRQDRTCSRVMETKGIASAKTHSTVRPANTAAAEGDPNRTRERNVGPLR